ncbi:uncharacterized protein LOC112159418 isoform X2 [Oryzias melastigma]|uniref:uncharacterized protein LOC112159418 isoform X2 n=1 Tax=Oryzias melastigma TaxID=30732 RepID=UPI000CF80161|nr:uncharacterized protein LOC112159418 isoform X2 [Oryzias melastigma]
MFDFTSLLFPLILTWMLTFTDVQTFREETVRVGDEVTLKCENANDFSDGCYRIIWIYTNDVTSTPKPTFKPSSKTRAFKSTTTLKSSSSSANSRSTTASALLSSDTHTAATNLHFKTGVWWRIIYVPVGVAALSVITVSVWIWTRT